MSKIYKNITLRVVGGLGNQLFILAFLLYLKKKLKVRIHLDVKSGYQNLFGSNKYKQIFILNKLNYKFFYQKDEYCFMGFLGKLKRFLIRKNQFFSYFFKTTYINENNNIDIIKRIEHSKNENIYIDGYFQDLKYIKTNEKLISDLIIKSIKIKKKNININNTLCILYSDYMYNHNKINSSLLLKIKKLSSSFDMAYIFSYKLSKKLNNFISSKKIVNIKPNNKKNSFRNLLMISKFKYYVTDNSTYHWWGIWLSKHKNKKIYKISKIKQSLLYSNYVN